MQKSEQAVLIVDDDEGICESLQDILLEGGYSVAMAHSFADAVAKMEQFAFSHVVIDLMLRTNFEGINFFLHVKNCYPDVKRVVLSGWDFAVVQQQVRKSNLHPSLEREILDSFVCKGDVGDMLVNMQEKFKLQERWWGNYHALLIAVQDYEQRSLNLTYPKQDAKKLSEILTTHYLFEPQNVQYLFDPSRQEIIRKLDELSRKLTEDDNLLIFYAGHGYKDKKNGRGYWMPRDACGDKPEAWLSHRDVRHWIARIHTKHTLLISDSCFSGDIAKRADRADKEITGDACQKVYNHFSKVVISSGNQYERVDDKSVFLDEMSKCLKNSPEHLSAYAVYKKIKFQITGKSDQQPDYDELPEAGKHEDEGDFIFIRR